MLKAFSKQYSLMYRLLSLLLRGFAEVVMAVLAYVPGPDEAGSFGRGLPGHA